jgi:L-ribulose-5-phosphate 3-epimerase
VIETGAPYLLDARRKHHPTLVSDDGRDVRVDLLRAAVRIAAELGAECVSFCSGMLPAGVDRHTGWRRLAEGVDAVLAEATRLGVPLGLEPVPGMLVERLDDVFALRARLGHPELLRITLDVGHCVAMGPSCAADCVRRAGALLVNVHLDDMRGAVHEHMEFGEGELDLPATLGALADVGYRGLAAVGLPRHSHAAPAVAQRSIAALETASWVANAQRRIRSDVSEIRTLLPAAGRRCGRDPADPSGMVKGTADDRARVSLLATLREVLPAGLLGFEVTELYRCGDVADKRGVLLALPALDGALPIEVGLDLVRDALRCDDAGLVEAAMGQYAARHLDTHSWRQGVLKSLLIGVPLTADADARVDDELGRMVSGFIAECKAAGRTVPDDATRLLGYLHFAMWAL